MGQEGTSMTSFLGFRLAVFGSGTVGSGTGITTFFRFKTSLVDILAIESGYESLKFIDAGALFKCSSRSSIFSAA
jgi:hypothetical protein